MSNNISNRQINGSLAGQIALNLDKRDGSADGQISQSVWNEFWDENGAANSKGKKENVGQNGVSVQDAFKFIMTRIFNTAKKQLADSEDKSWENEENKYNTINEVAKNLYQKAGGEKLKIDDIKAERTAQTEQSEQTETQQTPATIKQEPVNTDTTIQNRKNAHEKAVKEAVSIIEKNWEISGLGDKFKTEKDKQLYLNCLKEVVYDVKKEGAGHAEKGIIHIETNNEKIKTTSEMLKLLIHEANHAFKQRKVLQNGGLNYPTKEEEIECETLALKTASRLINAGLIDDYEIYGYKISEYTTEEIINNNPEFKNWVNGYCQLADNLKGDITVANNPYVDDIKIPEGGSIISLADNDTITINGNSYKVSKDGKLIAGNSSGQNINITNDCQIKAFGNVYNLSVSNLKLERPNIHINGGDVLKIDGQEYIIGKDRMLEGTEQTSLMRILVHNSDFSTPISYGFLEFEDVKLTDKEKTKLQQKEVNYENMKKVPFVIVQSNGKEIKGTCYLPK